jgi:hypothetical protein
MTLRRLLPFLFAAVALTIGVARAAEPEPVRLVAQPPLAAEVAAFPRIAATGEPALQRINQALTNADIRAAAAVKDCRAQAVQDQTEDGSNPWQRTVTVAMRGPAYLTLVAGENWYCGGAHPDNDTFALAYDLRTGSPLNWERLLPKTLAGTASLDTAGDGTRLGVLASPALTSLYMTLLKPDGDCVEALRDADLHFMLWPDAAHDGLTMAPSGLPHVIAACGDSATIPVATLRTLGVAPALLDAIEAGHKAGLYDPVK